MAHTSRYKVLSEYWILLNYLLTLVHVCHNTIRYFNTLLDVVYIYVL